MANHPRGRIVVSITGHVDPDEGRAVSDDFTEIVQEIRAVLETLRGFGDFECKVTTLTPVELDL